MTELTKDSMIEGCFKPNSPHSIRLDKAGSYLIQFSDSTTAEISVEDGYKFGGGRYKKSYIFDNCPWAFVIMHDRTYFYNRDTEESYIETISPDTIEEISADYVIFGNSNHQERTVYSLSEQKPILNVSNIIYFNENLILWVEDDELIIFNLQDNKIISRIKPKQYLIDKDKLLYASEDTISSIKLTEDYHHCELYKWKGNFHAILNNELSVYSLGNDSSSQLQVINHSTGELVQDLKIDGSIASVNGRITIDVAKRRSSILNFDLKGSDFPDATIKACYHDFIFYPCEWDVFYLERTTTITKTSSKFDVDVQTALHSLKSKLARSFNWLNNETKITENYFLIYNDDASFVRGRNYSGAGYNEGGRIWAFKDTVILDENHFMYELSRNGYWDHKSEGDYDFTKFEKFGIIIDNDKIIKPISLKDAASTNVIHFYRPMEYIRLGDKMIFEGGKELDGAESAFITGLNWTISRNFKWAICVDTKLGKVLLYSMASEDKKAREILNDFDSSSYHQVLFDESGKQILYRNSGMTEVRDIQTGATMEFKNMSYIEHVNGIRPSFQSASSLQPRIINPVSGQILDSETMKKYDFSSPDGQYYTGTTKDMYEEHYYLETGEIIPENKYKAIYDKICYPLGMKANVEHEKVTRNRIDFIKEHFGFINKTYGMHTHNSSEEKNWDKILVDEKNELGNLNFINRVIGVRGIAIIRRASDGAEVAKIELGDPLTFINYVSFSYDSRYIALAGYRNFSHGLFLVYDLKEQKTLCQINTGRAVWTTAFSRQGTIAAYTSDPNTAIFKDDYNCESKEEFDNHLIRNRNFLTFSPDGIYIALSDHGYVSKYDADGNTRFSWGHQPSTFVEIRNVKNLGEPIITFNDLSDCGIEDACRAKSVSSVAFSNDCKRLMMVGEDGVVIIRNLHIKQYANE